MAKRQCLNIVRQRRERNSQVPYYTKGCGDVEEGSGDNVHVHVHEQILETPPHDVSQLEHDKNVEEVKEDKEEELEEDNGVDQVEEEEEHEEDDMEDDDEGGRYGEDGCDTGSDVDSDMYALVCWK